MKTLEKHTLLYDKDCPLCNAYTSGFIKTNMLDMNGRKPFNELSNKEQYYIDIKRATNEIALVDTEHKTVIYGIDSLLKVIGNSFPTIEKIGSLKPINFLLQKLYSFISYNRKVIIPSKRLTESGLQCIPDFNYKYRFIYIIFAMVITTSVLFKFFSSISVIPEATIESGAILILGQTIFQSIFLLNLKRDTSINYIGNLMTISLMGSLLLIPILLLNSIVPLVDIFLLCSFGCIILIMLLEHHRRIEILELPKSLTYTWILYGVTALIIILTT